MFCKTVWNGIHILPDGYIRLCSLGSTSRPELDMQRARDKDGNVMHILTHDIKDIMNSDKHKEIRKFNVENPNGWSPHCDCCHNREIITGFDRTHKSKSRRVFLLNNVASNYVVNEHNFHEKTNSEGEVDWMPSSLDIRFGNLCNQKCVMCGPIFSNQWYEEWFDYFKTNEFGQAKEITVIRDPNTLKWIEPKELEWYEDPRWWVKFEQMAPYLRHIYITGGEPMITPAHDEMLDRLIDAGFSKQIVLEYDTNCSAINEKIAERWFNFRKVIIRGSMDAIGQQYELIRFGGKWDKFVKNVRKLKQYELESNKKIEIVALSTCFQMSTIYSIIESEAWCKDLGINFHLRFLESPAHHRVIYLPLSSKLELIEYFSRYVGISEKAEVIINHLKKHLDSQYEKPSAIQDYIKFMDYLDTTRNTNWKSVLPDVYTLISKITLS